jgi:gas vesicle protein GvpG
MLLQLLTAPISLPLAGFRFVLGQVQELAERELYDEDRIRDDLLLLQLRLEEGEIDEAEFQAEEAEVMARLRAARSRRQQAASGSPPDERP